MLREKQRKRPEKKLNQNQRDEKERHIKHTKQF